MQCVLDPSIQWFHRETYAAHEFCKLKKIITYKVELIICDKYIIVPNMPSGVKKSKLNIPFMPMTINPSVLFNFILW